MRFLDTSKALLDAILSVLPAHLEALRSRRLINAQPVRLRLWHFDQQTTKLGEMILGGNSAFATTDLSPLRTQLSTLQPGGVTNYDSWSSELRAAIAAHPTHLHSALLVTDGGATSRDSFFSTIAAIQKQERLGFFQCDCLGYGPWLDPSCVSFLAQTTGGEAMMVETLEGEATKAKVLGILARSVLRAGSRLTLRVHGAQLLTLRSTATPNDKPPAANYDALFAPSGQPCWSIAVG